MRAITIVAYGVAARSEELSAFFMFDKSVIASKDIKCTDGNKIVMKDISTIGYREIDKRANRSMLLANPFGETGRGCLVLTGV